MPRAQPAVVVENQCNRDGGVGVAIYVESAGAADTTNAVQVAVVHSTVSDPPLPSKRERHATEEVAKSLSNRTITRLRGRRGQLGALHPHVCRSDIANAIDDFLKSEKRLLIVRGLPGSGKTTAMLDAAQQHSAFITALSDTVLSDRWSAQLDRDLMVELGGAQASFLAFCSAAIERQSMSSVAIFVDELERASSPTVTIQQILGDLSTLPLNVKGVVAIRWTSFSTQDEARLLRRSDTVVYTVPVLHGNELQAFLKAYGLPNALPRGVRHVLTTPFAIRVLSDLGSPGKPFVNLGSMMECFVEELFSSSKAQELFLEAVGSTAVASNSGDVMSVKAIVAIAEREGIKLTNADCDSAIPTSALRFFIDKGILLEDREGIRATHDLWIECLAARALRAVFRERGMDDFLDLLLNVDFGVRWSSVMIMPGIFPETDLRNFAQRLVAVVATYLSNLTENEREEERHASLMVKHMMLGSDQPGPKALRHVLEMRRSSNTGNIAVLRASRAAELLTIMFAAVPNIIGPLVRESDQAAASWLRDALVPNVVLDPFVISLIDVANREAVLLLLEMIVSLMPIGIGGYISVDGTPEKKPIKLEAFEGPRLPTIFPRAKMNGFHLMFPYAFEYLPMVFPDLMAFASHKKDNHILGYLERIADYVSVAISMHNDSEAEWYRLVSRIPASALPIAGLLLGTVYPHVQPTTLLQASFQRLQQEPSDFEQIMAFNRGVVLQAMSFVLLGVDEASTERRLLQFAHAIDVWSLDCLISGAHFLEDYVKNINEEPDRLVLRCFVLLSFHLRHLAASESPLERGDFTQEQFDQAQQYQISYLEHEVDKARESLVGSLKQAYEGFHPQADPSRLPLELADWLRAHGRTAEAAEMERAGHVLSHVCDRVFGVPSADE